MNVEGRLLKNKYKIERKIAKGGMSTIYLCTNIELGNKWIAKHIEQKHANNMFEEKILKRLYHINLPKIVDVYRDDTGFFIIESYITGISLAKLMKNIGGLEIDKSIDYMLQLCEVLAYLHNMMPKPIIHKDLKPSNMIITEGNKLVLIDFGIAEEQGVYGGRLKAATNTYAPPEQLTLDGVCDTRGDIYSLGVILTQLIVSGRTKAHKVSAIHKMLLEIGEKCTAFYPEDRYQKAEDIKRDLTEVRDKLIVSKERNKINFKIVLILVVILSFFDYVISFIGMLVF